ncbi:MAG TPA: DUF5994 family protein [Pseudonocardia sp.]|jgi:hypothetical protein
MMSAPNNVAVQARVRLTLKPAGATTGYVDGGWWPRSNALEEELPELLVTLRERLGVVEAVSYHLGDWASPPRRITIEGVSVRLAGYHVQTKGTVDVIARDKRLTLLVVDPAVSERTANNTLDAAANPENTGRAATLLDHTNDE